MMRQLLHIDKLSRLFQKVRKQAVVSLLLMIFQGITEGTGLLLVLPLLSVAGVAGIGGNDNRIANGIERLMEQVGIPLSVSTVLILYVSIIIAMALLRYYQAVNTAFITQRVVQDWRNIIFKGLTETEWHVIQNLKNSDVQNVLVNEVRKLGTLSNQIIQFVGAVIMAIAYLSVSSILSLKLTLLAAAPVTLMFLLNRPLNRKSYQVGKTAVSFNQFMQQVIQEHLGSLKLVKVYEQESEHMKTFSEANESVKTQALLYAKTNQQSRLLFEIIAVLIVAVSIYASIVVLNTAVVELLLLVFIFARLFPKAIKAINNYQQILNLLPALEVTTQLSDTLEIEKPRSETGGSDQKDVSLKNEIHFNNVSFAYADKPVLTRSNFTIQANKVNVILGGSGAGKSTAIDLLLGLQKPSEGYISVDGIQLSGTDLTCWRKSIGYVPQDPFLFNRSILDNLLWAKSDASESETSAALANAGASNFVDLLPEKLNAIVGDRGMQLSGGERQRIALARALIRKPKILILDEATSAVDDKNEDIIREAINKLKGKLTVVLVAHRSKLIDLADNVIQL